LPARRVTLETAPERFWQRVDRRGPNECWPWTGEIVTGGYGVFRPLGRRSRRVRAHRWLWEQLHGPLPPGVVLDHLCHTPECVVVSRAVGCPHRRCMNPAHLAPATNRENVTRGNGWAGRKARQTHCIHGHPLTGTNLYVDPGGRRHCRECKRLHDRKP
jgi:HNH endonuclease